MADNNAPARRCARINYRGSLADGTVFDDNATGEPLEIILGGHSVMEPLDEALRDMTVGEERTIQIPAARAYGAYDPDGVQIVQTSAIPKGEELQAGMMIRWAFPKGAGNAVPARVLAADEWVVKLDFNHPLAGKDLVYWVKLTDLLD